MAIAAVTPRVRTIVVCDEITPSSTEAGVFSLAGVREHVVALSFPWRVDLSVFLLLSSPRRGKYPGKILIVNERTDRLIRYVKIAATFEEEVLSRVVDEEFIRRRS